jgi:predicted RNase H-like nuclease (RuvC/YqgF family)
MNSGPLKHVIRTRIEQAEARIKMNNGSVDRMQRRIQTFNEETRELRLVIVEAQHELAQIDKEEFQEKAERGRGGSK